MRKITIEVPQGIGDIFWVYQKFYPYFDQIDFRILASGCGEIQRRSVPFLQTWPKVGSVELHPISESDYCTFVSQRSGIVNMPADGSILRHAVNRPLEEGIRLEAIDPMFPPAWSIPLQCQEVALPTRFLCLYVSGSKGPGTWGASEWCRCLELIDEKYQLKMPIVMIGAGYDAGRIGEVAGCLRGRRFNVIEMINMPAAAVNFVLRQAALFVGYQSGLNVIADNFSRPQIMLYFIHLDPMRYSWCQPGHRENGLFNAFTFAETPGLVVNSLRSDLISPLVATEVTASPAMLPEGVPN